MFIWLQNNTNKAKEWSNTNPKKTAAIASITIPSILLLAHYTYQKLTNNMPPGPYRWPYAGNIPYIMSHYDKEDVLSIQLELAEEYGDIVTFTMFGLKTVVINNSQLAKKIFADRKLKEISNTKYALYKTPLFSAKDGEQNFVSLNGSKWSKRRKLFLSVFNKMLTTKFMNKVTGTAIKNVLIPEINQHIKDNKPFFPRDTMKYLSFQTVFYANFDRFIDKKDALYVKFRNAIEKNIQLSNTVEFINGLVWGKPFAKTFYDARDELSDILNQMMDQRRDELRDVGIEYKDNSSKVDESTQEDGDLSSAIKDLEFDSYLDYLLKLVNDGKIKNSVAEVETLLLFAGGYQNNALAFEWCVSLLAKYQSIQNKIRQELFDVHSIDNIHITDKKEAEINIKEFDLGLTVKCPLLRAFIHESLRISSFARASQGRLVPQDTVIEWKGKHYMLPKGWLVQLNIEYMLTRAENEGWISDKDGIMGLHLENFLDKKGKFKTHEAFALFGYGGRDCPGRAFAIKQILINVAYFVMNYVIEFSDEDKRKDPLKVKLTADRKKFVLEMDPQVALKFTSV